MMRTGIVALATLACLWTATAASALDIAADTALRPALEQIATLHARRTGVVIRADYQPSGRIARALESGRGVDLALLADDGFVSRLAAAGLADPDAPVFALGRIAVVTSVAEPVADWAQWVRVTSLVDAVTIPDPAWSPHGETAREVIAAHGLTERLRDRLRIAPDEADALAAVAEGRTPLALVPGGLASPAPEGLQVLVLPAATHRTLPFRALVTARGRACNADTVAAFLEFLASPAARDVLRRRGYDLP